MDHRNSTFLGAMDVVQELFSSLRTISLQGRDYAPCVRLVDRAHLWGYFC